MIPSAFRRALAVIGALSAALCWAAPADEGPAAKAAFTDSEIRVILSHGPWPARGADPSNRVSGNREAIDFGTRLFFEQRLSGTGEFSCARCHVPELNWTDSLRLSSGMAEVNRHTPTLMNLAAQRWYGWDGAADSLWSQILRPIVDKRELASSPRQVAQLVRDDPDLSCRYRKAFGALPSPANDEAVFVDVGKALAAFVETLVSGYTPFDRFRDDLAQGKPPAAWNYSEPAQRGLKIFIGKGGCTNCHSGPNFTGGEFFNNGLAQTTLAGKPDPGRPAGIQALLKSRFNLLGPYNDDGTGASAARTRQVSFEKAAFGEFKVPTLRNLVLTTPYGRDGSVDSLAEVVRHYSGIDPVRLHAKDGRPARPLDLTAREQTDLVVFLESLTSFANGWRPDSAVHCD